MLDPRLGSLGFHFQEMKLHSKRTFLFSPERGRQGQRRGQDQSPQLLILPFRQQRRNPVFPSERLLPPHAECSLKPGRECCFWGLLAGSRALNEGELTVFLTPPQSRCRLDIWATLKGRRKRRLRHTVIHSYGKEARPANLNSARILCPTIYQPCLPSPPSPTLKL